MKPLRPSRSRLTAQQIGRVAFILIVAAMVGWVATATTLATIVRRSDPVAAMRWWDDAETLASGAMALLQQNQSRATVERARALALRAAEREPVNVAAVRTLGIIADLDRRPNEARRYFLYAERLSRRDLPTQLWLIEDNVRRNQVEGALRHYDRALRASRGTRGALLPVLVRASGDPSVIEPLTRLVSGRPPWWPMFADQLVREGRSMPGLFRVSRGLRLDPGIEEERQLLARFLGRLADAGDFGSAYSLYAQAREPGGMSELLRDGGFEASGPYLPPFDWQLTDEPDLAAIRRPSEIRRGTSLALEANNGRGGDVARQLLALPPGRYRISLLAGGEGVPSSRPMLSVRCAGEGQQLMRLELPSDAETGTRTGAEFRVASAECRYQWLAISARSETDGSDARAWVDDITIRPL